MGEAGCCVMYCAVVWPWMAICMYQNCQCSGDCCIAYLLQCIPIIGWVLAVMKACDIINGESK